MSSLHDPFDLLETNTRIVPVLAKNKLEAMVRHTLTTPQDIASKKGLAPRHIWWSGISAAIAACLLLVVSNPQNRTPDFNPSGTPIIISETNTMTSPHTGIRNASDDDENDFGDMVVLATLEGQ